MSSRAGEMLSVQLFGESHGACVGVTLDGLPAGLWLPLDDASAFLARRAAHGGLTTARAESDAPRVVSGWADGRATGAPLTAVFDNAHAHSADYAFLPDRPRPGHADYPAHARGGGFADLRGGGHQSGRLTLPYAFAGWAALCLLRAEAGIEVYSHLSQVGDARDIPLDPVSPDADALRACRSRELPALDAAASERMRRQIEAARDAEDSVGGEIELVALGAPVGLGEPFFDGVEAVAARQLFSIPGVKAVAFGAGARVAAMRGSAYNDPYAVRDGRVVTATNRAGGLLGGMTNGMPILATVAFRPTASIAREQQTVSLSRMQSAALRVGGRHDPCIALRALPVAEAALGLALCELWLRRRGNAARGR